MPVRSALEPHAAREPEQPRLRRAVRARSGVADVRGRRRDVDDPPPALGDHGRKAAADRAERAVEVDVDRCQPRPLRRLGDPAPTADPGGVDQHVDRAEPRGRGGVEPLDRVRAADVEGVRVVRRAARGELRRRRLQLGARGSMGERARVGAVGEQRADRDGRAVLGEGQRDGAAEPGGATGHHGGALLPASEAPSSPPPATAPGALPDGQAGRDGGAALLGRGEHDEPAAHHGHAPSAAMPRGLVAPAAPPPRAAAAPCPARTAARRRRRRAAYTSIRPRVPPLRRRGHAGELRRPATGRLQYRLLHLAIGTGTACICAGDGVARTEDTGPARVHAARRDRPALQRRWLPPRVSHRAERRPPRHRRRRRGRGHGDAHPRRRRRLLARASGRATAGAAWSAARAAAAGGRRVSALQPLPPRGELLRDGAVR